MMQDGNEADVREEIAVPLLAALGYERGTANDISREVSLKYEYQFLGRKKRTDPPLCGRADYILNVLGAGRWVLETKPPHEPIDRNAIEQAISYARHPEISASYAVILNGKRITVHHTSQASSEPALVNLPVSNVISLAEQLRGLLSPAAIRRDCSPPVVDLEKPLAEGLRSSARILGGEICHDRYRWSSNYPLSREHAGQFDEMARRLTGLRIAVTGGSVYRDKDSRIRAKLILAMRHDEEIRFALDKKLLDAEYLAIGDHISHLPEAPTVFDVIGELEIREGEPVFDSVRWHTAAAGLAIRMRYSGQATGYISQHIFQGTFTSQHDVSFPAIPLLHIRIDGEGQFRVEVDGH